MTNFRWTKPTYSKEEHFPIMKTKLQTSQKLSPRHANNTYPFDLQTIILHSAKIFLKIPQKTFLVRIVKFLHEESEQNNSKSSLFHRLTIFCHSIFIDKIKIASSRPKESNFTTRIQIDKTRNIKQIQRSPKIFRQTSQCWKSKLNNFSLCRFWEGQVDTNNKMDNF